jgi:hypothetical protein
LPAVTIAATPARERLLVGLEEAADLRDHASARGRGHRGPRTLGGASGAAGVDEALRVGQQHVGDDVGAVRGIGRFEPPAGRVGALLSVDDRGGCAK